jgi:hypothetical protein
VPGAEVVGVWLATVEVTVGGPPATSSGRRMPLTTWSAGAGITDAAERPVAVAKRLATAAAPTIIDRRFRRGRVAGHDAAIERYIWRN